MQQGWTGQGFFSRALRAPELERCESVTFLLAHLCLAILIIFAEQGGAGNLPFLSGMASIPDVQQLSNVPKPKIKDLVQQLLLSLGRLNLGYLFCSLWLVSGQERVYTRYLKADLIALDFVFVLADIIV